MAYNRRKRKVKKNIPEAVAHIHSTYNNTIVTITEKDGNVIAWASSGTIGYKGSRMLVIWSNCNSMMSLSITSQFGTNRRKGDGTIGWI